jgi:2-oxoglutarate ferredoxin oxidoreductase subunit delta
MAKVRGAIEVNSERCKGCGVCTVNCPQQVIALGKQVNSKGYYFAEMAFPEKWLSLVSGYSRLLFSFLEYIMIYP